MKIYSVAPGQNVIVNSIGNLTRQLAAVADSLGPVVAPVEQRGQLIDLCALTRLSVGAASVSIARVDDGDLVYEAAEGRSAERVIGLRLPSDQGIAGYVASTGQSMVVDRVLDDPRFARDVAERIGFVPTSLLVVPVLDANDGVLGVVSVLDRTTGVGDPLVVTSAAARVAAPLLAISGGITRLGPLLVRALADAVATDDRTLVPGLRRLAANAPSDGAAVAELAALLAEVRVLPLSSQQAVARVVQEMVALAAPRRRW